ncbi:dnaJ homolog subfamily C member 16-like [Glandiceps talaboti]
MVWKNSGLFHVLFVSCLLAIFCTCSQDFNPYQELGVSRTASTREIKTAYKQLAKEWHPDKNREPGAADKFMKIQAAYEVLSDDQRRHDYDNYGFTEPNENRGQGQRNPFGGFHGSFFDGFNFKFNFENNQRRGTEQRHRLDINRYHSHVLPISHRKPYLIFVTADWCFTCMQVEPHWQEVVKELEPLGVGISVVNSDYDRRLIEELGVSRVPAILAVLQGRVYRFQKLNTISVNTMKNFLQSLFPSGLVRGINDNNYEDFLSGWKDNKPRSLLFSKKKEASLLYLLVALENKDRVAFGFATLSNQDTKDLRKKYVVNAKEPTLLIFREDILNYAYRLEANEMQTGAVRDAVRGHYFLTLPRLSSQAVFEQLCSISSTVNKKFCVVLITQDNPEHDEARAILREFIQENTYSKDKVRFSYVYEGTQNAFVNALSKGQVLKDHWPLPLAVIWRKKSFRVAYEWLPNGWSGNRDQADIDKQQLKTYLDKVISGKTLLPKESDIEDLINEDYSIMTYILNGISSGVSTVVHYFTSSRWEETLLTIAMFAIYLLPILLIFGGAFSLTKERNTPDERPRRRQPENPVYNLTGISQEFYNRFVVDPYENSYVLLLLVDRQNKEELVASFLNEVVPMAQSLQRQHIKLSLTYVSIEAYYKWFERLNGIQPTSRNYGKEYSGTVLVLNGCKKYYSVFTPPNAINAEGVTAENERLKHRGQQNANGDSVGQDDSASDNGSHADLFVGISTWLERLCDGSLEKHYVESWPPLSGR